MELLIHIFWVFIESLPICRVPPLSQTINAGMTSPILFTSFFVALVTFSKSTQIYGQHMLWYKSKLAEGIQIYPVSGKIDHIDCTNNSKQAGNRYTMVDPNTLDMSCSAIRRRNKFSIIPSSTEERNFPILFIRILYRDYLFTEKALATEFQPQNYYCFLVDVKADQIYKERMSNLGKCLPNVVVKLSHLSIKSSGANMTNAYLECMWAMQKFQWKYVITLQQHDFVIRANWELVEILRLLNGSSHMQMVREERFLQRLNRKFSWTISSLRLLDEKICASIHLSAEAFSANCDYELQIAKGGVQMLLSRQFIDFVLHNLNVSTLVAQLDTKSLTDEIFWQSINYDPILQAPGGFPGRCLEGIGRREARTLTRFAAWEGSNETLNEIMCPTGNWRHKVCILGVEDVPRLLSMPQILINKIMPTFDAAPAMCLAEEIMRRQTAGRVAGEKNFVKIKVEYEKLVEVRYSKWIAAGNKESTFRCDP